jgi:hypothetical protein
MRAHYAALEKEPPAAQAGPAASTSYNRSENLLTLRPQPRQ